MDLQRAMLHELMGAGPCDRIHDQKLKESFEKSPGHKIYLSKFESELAQQCEKLVMDLDRRIRHGREHLAQEEVLIPPHSLSATDVWAHSHPFST